MLRSVIIAGAVLAFLPAHAWADLDQQPQPCSIPADTVHDVQSKLDQVITFKNGGSLFAPNNMWSAIVDRKGVLCSVKNTGTPPASDPWPGSRSIAIAKASTANDFSNNKKALSTANLYGVSQPGGSLWGLNESNPFNPRFQPQGTGIGFVPGGIITFGGGVALYYKGQVIGGLGVSGDTSCVDHTIAYTMRHLAGLDNVPGGVADGGKTDNIIYSSCPANASNTPACVAGLANTFTHPHCSDKDVVPPSHQ